MLIIGLCTGLPTKDESKKTTEFLEYDDCKVKLSLLP